MPVHTVNSCADCHFLPPDCLIFWGSGERLYSPTVFDAPVISVFTLTSGSLGSAGFSPYPWGAIGSFHCLIRFPWGLIRLPDFPFVFYLLDCLYSTIKGTACLLAIVPKRVLSFCIIFGTQRWGISPPIVKRESAGLGTH